MTQTMEVNTDLSLAAHVRELEALRETMAQKSQALLAAQDAFDAEYSAEIAELTAAKTAVAEAEANVKGLALVAYDNDPTNNQLTAGVSIALVKAYKINEATVMAYAKANPTTMGGLIKESLDMVATMESRARHHVRHTLENAA